VLFRSPQFKIIKRFRGKEQIKYHVDLIKVLNKQDLFLELMR